MSFEPPTESGSFGSPSSSPFSSAPSSGPPLASGLGRQISPTVSGVYSYAWGLLSQNFIPLLVVGIVYWLVAEGVSAVLSAITHGGGLAELYGIVVSGPLGYGLTLAYLDAVRGRIPTVQDLWVPFKRNYLNVLISSFLLEIILGVGFVLLIVPGIYLAVRLCFVPYLVMNENMGPWQSIQASMDRTSGYGWTIFGVGLLSFLAIIVGLIILVVGVIPASMLVSLVFASLYLSISARKGIAV